MVCYHERYTAQGEMDQQSPSFALAKQIAQGVLEYLGIDTLEEYEKLRSNPNHGVFDRGEELPDGVYDVLGRYQTLS